MSCGSVISKLYYSLLSWVGIIATNFFTHTFKSVVLVDFDISEKAVATSALGLAFLSFICSQMEL
jgi:hypothetical protein